MNPCCYPILLSWLTRLRRATSLGWRRRLFLRCNLINRSDDQRVDGRRLTLEPTGRDRPLSNEHSFTHTRTQNVEGHESRVAAIDLDLQKRAIWDFIQSA
jgi:hypothetical protein